MRNSNRRNALLLMLLIAAIAAGIIGSGRSDDKPLQTPVGRVTPPAAENTPRLSQSRLRHIIARHWPDSTARSSGKFAAPMSESKLRAYIIEAARVGTSRGNTGARPGTLLEYDFGRPIGTTIDGDEADRIRVVVDDSNAVVTAFPF